MGTQNLSRFKAQGGAVVGLGPEATQQFIKLLTRHSIQQTAGLSVAGTRIPFVMQFAQVPQEAEALVLGGQASGENLMHILEDVFAKSITKSFEVLENAQCTFAHIHCNTLGLVVEAFGIKKEFSPMQVLTVADAITAEFQELARQGIKHIFPIGTGMTVNGIPELESRGVIGGMYDNVIREAGLDLIKPTSDEQFIINQAILGCVQGSGNISGQTETFETIIKSRGILPFSNCALLICCTDLNEHGDLLKQKGFQVIDTAESVVRMAVKRVVDSLEA